MATKSMFNWGIIGLGKIAHRFAKDLRFLPHARIHAVASHQLEDAQNFARDYGAEFAYDDNAALLSTPGLDAVYIATPHTAHRENVMQCLEARLPVLCEKPFCINLEEGRAMVELARRNGVFLMEAEWTRFNPAMRQVLTLIEKGEIGFLHVVRADLGFRMPFDPDSRLFDKSLGGGALLDLGIYPVMLAHSVFGPPNPRQLHATAILGSTGVDESCAFLMRYPDQRLFLGQASIVDHTPAEAWFYGSEGRILLHPEWHHAQKLSVFRYDKENEGQENHYDLIFPLEGEGFWREAEHVMACLEAGRLESNVVPLDFTLGILETLDAIRAKIGLEYEGE